MQQRILAIDLGKNKSVFCDYDAQTGQHTFGTLATTPADMHDLLVKHAGHLVVIETCPLAGWVSDLCVVEEVEATLDAMAEVSVRVVRLTTVPGVGKRTAEVVAAMLDDPHRFGNVGQVGAYTGLTPRRLQSGQMDLQLGISRAGSGLLRKMLVQASWAGQRNNPWMREVFERVCGGKKDRRKTAIVAVARHLFVRLWAMDKSGRDWNGPPAAPLPRRTRSASSSPTSSSSRSSPSSLRHARRRGGGGGGGGVGVGGGDLGARVVALGAPPQTPPR